MVREYLKTVADRTERRKRIRKLNETFRKYSGKMGPRTWVREDLYEREGL